MLTTLNLINLTWLWVKLNNLSIQFRRIIETPILKIGNSVVSLSAIMQLLGVFFIALIVTLSLKRLLSNQVLERLGLKQGTRESIATVVSYGFGAFFCVIVLQAIGVNLASLTVVAGSLGVGIGFGLQDITRNFISGITLLVEQKLKVGDFIEWEGLSGYVEEISLRSTVIRTITQRYIIIPNSALVSDRVINWTYHDTKGWVSLPISVPHESDPVTVIEVLMDSAYLEETVSFEHRPEVYLVGFSLESLDFQLWVWVNQIDKKYLTESSLRFIIEQNLRQHGIRLAAPRMDLWQRNPSVVVRSSAESYAAHATLQKPELVVAESFSKPISTRDLLRRIPYFRDCSELELRKMVELGYRRHLRTGETLYKAGDPGEEFYIVLQGAISYTIPGATTKMGVLGSGRFAGEFSLMLGIPRTVTMVAMEETTVFAMSPQGFKKLMQAQPQLYDLMVEEMGQHQQELSHQKVQLGEMGILNRAEYDPNPVAWIRKQLEKLLKL